MGASLTWCHFTGSTRPIGAVAGAVATEGALVTT